MTVCALIVKELASKSNASLRECSEALEYTNGDMDKAFKYLKYNGCAVFVKPKEGQTDREAYNEWLDHMIENG